MNSDYDASLQPWGANHCPCKALAFGRCLDSYMAGGSVPKVIVLINSESVINLLSLL